MCKKERKTRLVKRKRLIEHPVPERTADAQRAANELMKRCGCECHQPGGSVMHFMACCSFCYEKIEE